MEVDIAECLLGSLELHLLQHVLLISVQLLLAHLDKLPEVLDVLEVELWLMAELFRSQSKAFRSIATVPTS